MMPKYLLYLPINCVSHYKDLDEGKWVRVEGWGTRTDAEQEILDSINMYKDAPVKPNF